MLKFGHELQYFFKILLLLQLHQNHLQKLQKDLIYYSLCLDLMYYPLGAKWKSYLAKDKNFWPLGLYEGQKAKKDQKTKCPIWREIQ